MPKSVCMSFACGAVFDGDAATCPECGGRAVPQGRIRALGAVSIACGVLLLAIMAAVLWFAMPVMLAAGGDVGGARWTGTADQTIFALAIFAMVVAVGVVALVAGLTQLRHGRRHHGAIRLILGVAGVLIVIGWLVRRGVIS